jgi:hypothetical protein
MPYAIDNINEVVTRHLFPTVMMWNRVEGRPRATKDFDRALKAEVRDALWMLTKQWQMGEFEGDDAGSPVLAKIRMDTTRLTKYQANENPVQFFPNDIPFEAQVEQKVVPLQVFHQKISLDLRLMTGRRWKKILTNAGLPGQVWDLCLQQFPILLPDPTNKNHAAICAHPDAWQQFAAVAGRAVDGFDLYQYLKKGLLLKDLPGGGVLADEPVNESQHFTDWVDRQFLQPNDPADNAWIPSRFEYKFQCSAPESTGDNSVDTGEQVFTAKEYYHGHLDWYNLNIDKRIKTLGAVETPPVDDVRGKVVRTVLPTPVVFDGMPNTRWWAFENGRVNYSFIKPGTQELSKLLFLEFGLVYANDWYIMPFDLPVGSIAKVRGLSVSNVFGEHFWLEASGRGLDEDWDRWNMFTLNIEGNDNIPADTSLLLLPTVPKIQEGKPAEKIVFIRDEMANMVWGIETIVPLPHGDSVSGSGAAAQYRAFLQKLYDDANSGAVDPVDEAPSARIRYEIMNEVPENWIPFVPVHLKDDNREVQLQRAAMPRFLKGDTSQFPDKVRPRTSLLVEGLEQKLPFYVYEEEIPRDGAVIYQSFQRTRWKNGEVFVWFGSRKTTGRGEGSSGLAFDRILGKSGQV